MGVDGVISDNHIRHCLVLDKHTSVTV